MGFVTDYFQSTQMAQDLQQVKHSSSYADLEYVNQVMTCALLRWQQWFENPYVDRDAVQMRPTTKEDFQLFCRAVLQILATKDIREETIQPKINQVLINHAKTKIIPGEDFLRRFAMLATMGACEYHGFNAYFINSIQQHGIDPKYQNTKHLEPIYRALKRVGSDTELARFKHDQKIYVTPDPRVAYVHSRISPKWFYFFNSDNCAAYMNRDYDTARQNLFKFPGHEKLNQTERTKISNFFEEWWKKLTKPNSQKIAVMPMFRDAATLQKRLQVNTLFVEKFGIEKLLNGAMYTNYENIYEQPIAPELIQIIDVPTATIQTQKLSQMQDVFHPSNLQTQADHELTAG